MLLLFPAKTAGQDKKILAAVAEQLNGEIARGGLFAGHCLAKDGGKCQRGLRILLVLDAP